ncbi:unnamed protein product, partial [Brassica oleracea var. botrytis]
VLSSLRRRLNLGFPSGTFFQSSAVLLCEWCGVSVEKRCCAACSVYRRLGESVVYVAVVSSRSEISRVSDLSPEAPLVVSGGGAWVCRWSCCVSISRFYLWRRVVLVEARGGSAW